MRELQRFFLTIVTENHKEHEKAKSLAGLLQTELGLDWKLLSISQYPKFENSFKIEFSKTITKKRGDDELSHYAISLTDNLISPWLVFFDRHLNTIELVYNKNENTRVKRKEFDAIKWGHLQIIK